MNHKKTEARLICERECAKKNNLPIKDFTLGRKIYNQFKIHISYLVYYMSISRARKNRSHLIMIVESIDFIYSLFKFINFFNTHEAVHTCTKLRHE